MKLHTIIVFLVLLLFCNMALSQEKQTAKPNRVLRNWVAAQAGEIAGWGTVSIGFYIVNGFTGARSEEQEDQFIAAGIIAGHLCGNLLLKQEARQNIPAFLKNLVFSALPVAAYAVFREPKILGDTQYFEETGEKVDLILISLFVTPIFATLGNEIFNRQQSPGSPEMGLGVQPYISTVNKDYRLGFVLRL